MDLPTIIESNVCGEMFIVVWHQHFICCFIILKSFVILTLYPKQTCLYYIMSFSHESTNDEFLESWNRHPLRTERSWPPRKIRLNGIMSCNSTQVGVQSVTNSIDPDKYRVDEEGPLPLEMDCDDVVVPGTVVPLVRRQLDSFQQAVDPLEQCDDLGVSMFVRAKQLLSQVGQV